MLFVLMTYYQDHCSVKWPSKKSSFAVLIRTSTQFPETMHQAVRLSTWKAKICCLSAPEIQVDFALLGKVSMSAFLCVFS